MLGSVLDKAVVSLARSLEKNDNRLVGIGATMRLARIYNRWRFHPCAEYRRDQYLHHFQELLRENGPPAYQPPPMEDGWCLNTGRQLPHLDQLLADAERIIAERGKVKRKGFGEKYLGADKLFIQNILHDGDLDRYPSILDFATSSEILSVVCQYFGMIPTLSASTPPAVRLVESWAGFDEESIGRPYASQLFHLDFHDSPTVYVIVPLREITDESGPFCFFSASTSRRAARALRYRQKGRPYRITDEEMYRVAAPNHLHRLISGPGEKILFVDSSRCFHYGSRDAVKPRYQMMFAYVTPCRTDFTEILRIKGEWLRAPNPKDSCLKKMLFGRHYLGEEATLRREQEYAVD